MKKRGLKIRLRLYFFTTAQIVQIAQSMLFKSAGQSVFSPWRNASHSELLCAAMRMVAGSYPVLVIVLDCHIGLALLCSFSTALEYHTKSLMCND